MSGTNTWIKPHTVLLVMKFPLQSNQIIGFMPSCSEYKYLWLVLCSKKLLKIEDIWLVPENTLHLSHNHPLFFTQVSFTFIFSIAPYTLPFVISSFVSFILMVISILGHSGSAYPTTHCPSTTVNPGSNIPPLLLSMGVTFVRLRNQTGRRSYVGWYRTYSWGTWPGYTFV